MKVLKVLFPLMFLVTTSFAQQKQITCSSIRNSDNSISIYAESMEYGEYTIKLIFSSLVGYRPAPGVTGGIAFTTIDKGKREIMKLALDKYASTYELQYSYTYYSGRALHKIPDTAFAYLLPATAGTSLRTFPVSSIAAKLNLKNYQDNYQSTGFVYKIGDTICASRAGIVYDCNDDVKEGEVADQFYKSERNNIYIEHKDGSLDRYNIIAPIKLLVKSGDNVYPGQPLAIFNKVSDRYYLIFSTYYLDQYKMNALKTTEKPVTSAYVYLPTYFFAAANEKPALLETNKTYITLHPKDVIVAELSKRDKKKLGFD